MASGVLFVEIRVRKNHIAEESRTHTPCGENFSRLSPNLVLQDAYLASTRFDKIPQKIQRRRVLRSFARANISQMQRENAKQYKILRAFCLPQVQISAAQNRVSSTLFGYNDMAPAVRRMSVAGVFICSVKK